MALRNILKIENDSDILRKKSRDVNIIDSRIITLLEDMKETMYEAQGVGLAAPQVGVLKKVVVIDIGDGLIELINPIIVYQKGEQIDEEGCLSIPGEKAYVKRPQKVIVRALNRNGETFELEAEGLLARACCHEIDHLSGVMYVDKVCEAPKK